MRILPGTAHRMPRGAGLIRLTGRTAGRGFPIHEKDFADKTPAQGHECLRRVQCFEICIRVSLPADGPWWRANPLQRKDPVSSAQAPEIQNQSDGTGNGLGNREGQPRIGKPDAGKQVKQRNETDDLRVRDGARLVFPLPIA